MAQQEQPHRFRLVRAGNLTLRPVDWLVAGLFERDSTLQIFGDPSAGKTFWALDLSCCVAADIKHHGRAVKPGPVVYVAGEGHNGIVRRLKAWTIRNRIELGNVPLYVSNQPAMMTDPVSLSAVLGEIGATGERPALVVLDTLARNFGPGDENGTADMVHFVRACDEIRSTFNCTVAIVHHTGHGDKSRSRGSSVLQGAVDAAYRLNRDGDIIRVQATKMKDGPLPDPFAFEFRTVELGMDNEDGTPATSAVLYPVDVPNEPRQTTSRNQGTALEVLDAMITQRRRNLEQSGYDATTIRVSERDWRDTCIEKGMARRSWYDAKGSLATRALIELQPGGFVCRSESSD